MPGALVNNTLFKLKSFPPLLDLSDVSIEVYPKIYFYDSLLETFPYAEVYFNDRAGWIMDKIYYVEGLDFDLQLGNDLGGYLGHSYCWAENQVNDVTIGKKMGGTNVFIFISSYSKVDKIKNAVYTGRISDVVRQIATTDLGILDTSNIYNTVGVDTWNQFAMESKDFLLNLSDIAKSPNYPFSPFYTFVNSNGEFYFASLGDLFSQLSLATYYFADETATRTDTVKKFTVLTGGYSLNKENYNQKLYSMNTFGIVTSYPANIENYFLKNSIQEKLLIRRDDVNPLVSTNSEYLGIYNPIDQLETLNGRINNLYTDTNLGYRVEIVVDFNPSLVTGKIITLDMDSISEEKIKATEYCGKWLIIISEHYADLEGQPYSKLTLARSGVPVDNSHKLRNSFIG